MLSNNAQNKLEVTIKMVDGTSVTGSIVAGLSAGLFAAINKDQPFIEVIAADGQKFCVGQAHIMSIEEVVPFRKVNAPAFQSENASNAFELMGLNPGCTPMEAQKKYHAMVKLYHPDKYESIDLPPEIKKYLSDVSQKLSTAYGIVTRQISK